MGSSLFFLCLLVKCKVYKIDLFIKVKLSYKSEEKFITIKNNIYMFLLDSVFAANRRFARAIIILFCVLLNFSFFSSLQAERAEAYPIFAQQNYANPREA